MNFSVKSILAIMVTGFFWAGSSFATDYDFSGKLDYQNSVATFSFTAADTSLITLFSSSWDDGGFDPIFTLWDANGGWLYSQDDNGDDGTASSNGVNYGYGKWDAYFTYTVNAGTYSVTLSANENYPNVNKLGGKLTDGFFLDKTTKVSFASSTEAAYEFHILDVKTTPTNPTDPVPEPTTFVLLGGGLIGLALARKSFRK